ncbi:GNAT family N-acetyltransferase [Labilibacter marinus]|uniref:GNAT family N-acetyltransferase n=1 Tax=Labilibacter marinus TaxID=1477105 RepID=UPI0008376318|nr:GNAT family N-acetyltransferase [Labilibacter marinus]
MIKLNPSAYSAIENLLKSVNINHLFALAVVENKVKGEVFIDDVKNPQSFYFRHPYGMSLLFGSTKNESFNKCLKSYLLNADKQRSQPEWLQVYPMLWNEKLADLLQAELTTEISDDKKVVLDSRINFKFKKVDFISLIKVEEPSIVIKRTTEENYNLITGQVVPQYFYNNSAHFIKDGVGFSVMYNGMPVATAFAAFIIKNKLEIGIETLSGYRGKGLAKRVCSALIEYCSQNNLEPVWSCKGSNVASIKLAESLGFKQILTFPYYKLPCN